MFLDVDFEEIDVSRLRKKLDPMTNILAPNLSRLYLVIKEVDPNVYFRNFLKGAPNSPPVQVSALNKIDVRVK